jgi:large subunit ribosomal protein L25
VKEEKTMEQVQITSRTRTGTGKGVARQLRRQGFVPAVLYGGKLGNIPLSVNTHDLRQIIVKEGDNALIQLAIEGDGESKRTTVLIKNFQKDPVMQTLLHVDFLEISMEKVIEVNIALELVGESPGVKAGGILEFVTREVTVECLPGDIVEQFEVDTSTLEIGDSVTVSDIALDTEKFTLLTDPETTVAMVSAPMAEEVEEEEGEEELTEPEVIQKGKKTEEEE